MTDIPLAHTRTARLSRRLSLMLLGVALLFASILMAVSVGVIAVPLGTVWSIPLNHLIPDAVPFIGPPGGRRLSGGSAFQGRCLPRWSVPVWG